MLRKIITALTIITLTSSCASKLNQSEGSSKKELKRSEQIVRFDFDSFELTNKSQRKIKDKYLKIINQAPFKKIIIEGHADERGTHDYNYNLGLLRASEVKYELMDHGLDGDKIKVVSYGETMPISTKSNEKAWKKNRRAEIIIKR